MSTGWIRDYSQRTSADERQDFETGFFQAATGTAKHRDLAWGTIVDIDDNSFDDTTARVQCTLDGDTAWVTRGHLVKPRYIKTWRKSGETMYRAPLYRGSTGSNKRFDLLWGDCVQVIGHQEGRYRVHARGFEGWVNEDHVGDEPLLEVYFIDVGQGDGVLVKTPDGRHLMIDGGYERERQITGKNAADFVDWKFFDDYGHHTIHLDAMVASHCDADHYGGLSDLLNTSEKARAELDAGNVSVERFFHAGVSWWVPSDAEISDFGLTGDMQGRWLGPSSQGYLTRLLGNGPGVIDRTKSDAVPKLQGNWKTFISRMGKKTTNIDRIGLHSNDIESAEFLPGWSAADSSASVRVFGPINYTRQGSPAVKDYDVNSQNTNGHSLLLRFDYGHARILMTGDLNKNSMQSIRNIFGEHMRELACDVAKACHHGSEDVSYSFLSDLKPAATVISSGDAEGHAQPRPVIIAASGLTVHVQIDTENDELLTPLVYATEIERSMLLGEVQRVAVTDYPDDNNSEFSLFTQPPSSFSGDLKTEATTQKNAETRSRVHYKEAAPGRFRRKRGERSFWKPYVMTGVVYGLVNVRTDGNKIMCATMREEGGGWTIRTFDARF
jgi:hypothetical protein